MEQTESGMPDGDKRLQAGLPCTNCGHVFDGQWCPQCGERRPARHDYRICNLFGEWLSTLLNTDSRLHASLRDLLWRPGELSAAWFEGRRQRYLRIVQIFVLATLYYLIHATYISPAGLYTPLWAHTNANMSPLHHAVATEWISAWLAEEGREWETLSTTFDQRVRVLGNTLIFLLSPLTALPMALLLWRLKRSLVEHLVFCLHMWAFLIIILTTVGFMGHGLQALWAGISAAEGDALEAFRYRMLAETLVINIAMIWYSWFGLGRFYRLGRWWRAILLPVMVALSMLALVAYRAVLFFLTWFTAI